MDGTPEVWRTILEVLHPRTFSLQEWDPKLVGQMLPVAHKYDIQAVLLACSLRATRFNYSSDPSSDLYALTWLGYAEQYQVGTGVRCLACQGARVAVQECSN